MRQNALLPANNTLLSARKKESMGENVAEIKAKKSVWETFAWNAFKAKYTMG